MSSEDKQRMLWIAVRRALLGLVGSIFVIVRAVEKVYELKAAKVPVIEAPPKPEAIFLANPENPS